MLEHECPNCDKELMSGFGEDVYCDVCNKTYETEWDYTGETMTSWIVCEIIDKKTTL